VSIFKARPCRPLHPSTLMRFKNAISIQQPRRTYPRKNIYIYTYININPYTRRGNIVTARGMELWWSGRRMCILSCIQFLMLRYELKRGTWRRRKPQSPKIFFHVYLLDNKNSVCIVSHRETQWSCGLVGVCVWVFAGSRAWCRWCRSCA